MPERLRPPSLFIMDPPPAREHNEAANHAT